MDQAISYANAQEIQAEFAVYTNGTVWNVQRRINGKWIPIPDIPHRSSEPDQRLTELLRGLHDLAPILYQLDEPLERDSACLYLSAMQRFFIGGNLLTDCVDADLLAGTDNLLRVLSSADHHHLNYRFGKLEAARKHFESYRKRARIGYEIHPVTGEEGIQSEIWHLHGSLLTMINGADGLVDSDLLVLRLNIALTEYGRNQVANGNYPKIGSSFYQSLREFLNFTLAVSLNTRLPSLADPILVGDMQNYCRPAWDNLEREDHGTFKDFVAVWLAVIRSRFLGNRS
jgi:hypothetical protein